MSRRPDRYRWFDPYMPLQGHSAYGADFDLHKLAHANHRNPGKSVQLIGVSSFMRKKTEKIILRKVVDDLENGGPIPFIKKHRFGVVVNVGNMSHQEAHEYLVILKKSLTGSTGPR